MVSRPVTITNTDPQFYPLIGPFLANRAVHKALGGPPWDDPAKTWLVIRDAKGAVVAFCGITQGSHRSRTVLESLYVIPKHEQHDDAVRELIQAAVDQFGHDQDLHTTVRHTLLPAHAAAGFAVVREKTNFAELVRPADIR